MITEIVNNEDVEIHCSVHGKGPPVIMLHGVPDHSGGWHYQIEALKRSHTLICPDLRGINRSSKPLTAEAYSMRILVSDVAAIIDHFGFSKVNLLGHDFGGAIAWWTAITLPRHIKRLAVLSSPHPIDYITAARSDPAQQNAMEYIRTFLTLAGTGELDMAKLSSWVNDEHLHDNLKSALDNTPSQALANYYLGTMANLRAMVLDTIPKVQTPTLVVRGQLDPYVLPHLYADTWRHVDAELNMVCLPRAGHFIHHEAHKSINHHLQHFFG